MLFLLFEDTACMLNCLRMFYQKSLNIHLPKEQFQNLPFIDNKFPYLTVF